jgi:hypothetical protein
MDAKSIMRGLLEKMIQEAEAGDMQGLQETNSQFNGFASATFGTRRTEEYRLYDNCRQSCVGALYLPGPRELFIADAKERLAQIQQ